MKFNDSFKYPRLHVTSDLAQNAEIALETSQVHYLKSVLRKNIGDHVRLFNGHDGEWITKITALEKKHATLTCETHFKPQPETQYKTHLLFAPIKKKNMEFLVEKAVELGVTNIHPVITAHTQHSKINTERFKSQILEACEQCERLEIPALHTPQKLEEKINTWKSDIPLYWAAERSENAKNLKNTSAKNQSSAYLIGPEGGFSTDETTFLENADTITPITLGDQILRAETAAIYCLSAAKLNHT